jgi:hypothetical protein
MASYQGEGGGLLPLMMSIIQKQNKGKRRATVQDHEGLQLPPRKTQTPKQSHGLFGVETDKKLATNEQGAEEYRTLGQQGM